MLGYIALLGRIVLLGYERIVVKQLGQKSNSIAATFLFFAIASVLLLPVVALQPLPTDWGFLQYAALSSFFYAMAFTLYVKSLSIGEASLVSPLYNFNVFFLLILASVFLGEAITALKVAGLALLVLGASFLNRQKNVFSSLGALLKDKACLLMLACSALMAIGRVIDGFVVREVSPIIYSFVLYSFVSIFLLAHLVYRRDVGHAVSLFRQKTKIAIAAGAVNAYSYLLLLFAFTQIPVSVAEPASMLGMVVTVLLAKMIFKEKIRDRLVGVGIMILGAWLLFLG